MQSIYLKSLVFVLVLFLLGCASDSSKKLFSWRYPKVDVHSIKTLILKEGYTVWDEEVVHCKGQGSYRDCYTLNRYVRSDLSQEKNKPITILFSYKETKPPSDYYRNLGITVAAPSSSPQIEIEIERMENILFEKLLEVAGKTNVVRGER